MAIAMQYEIGADPCWSRLTTQDDSGELNRLFEFSLGVPLAICQRHGSD